MTAKSSTVDAKGGKLSQYLVDYLKCFAWLNKMRTEMIWQLGGWSDFMGLKPDCSGLGVSEETEATLVRS